MRSRETMGKTETQYKTDKTGSEIENIPFSEYIKDCSSEKEYITAQVHENNSGEENSAAISEAIDALGSEGGTVYIPSGEYKFSSVELKNINVRYRDTEEKLTVLSNVPEKSMSDYPDIVRVSHIYIINHELSGYWDLPCYGLFIRYADIDYSDFSCEAHSCNTREFVSAEN